eukprot:EG_transcript_4283
MTSPSDAADPAKRPKGLSRLKRVWVTKAVSGDVEIQRLSHLAIMERRKHSYRYRMVQDGSVIALFHTKADLEDALANPSAPTYNEQLSRRVSGLSDDSPQSPNSRSGLQRDESLSRDESLLSRDQSLFSRTQSMPDAISPTSKPSPISKEPKVPPKMERRVSFSASLAAPKPPAADSDDEGLSPTNQLSPPTAAIDGSPTLLAAAAEKARMSEEQRASRRKSLWKPADPAQEPPTGAAAEEQALVWSYHEPTGEWTSRPVKVRLAPEPFAEGAMRQAIKMRMKEKGVEREFVAKQFNAYTETEVITPKPAAFGPIAPDRPCDKPWMLRVLKKQPDSDFAVQLATAIFPEDLVMPAKDFLAWQVRVKMFQMDVEMQGFCQTYADAYNKRDPPKPVVFLDAFLIVCMDRSERTIYACEPMISGDYVKHNSNSGGVRDGLDARNTPQAFSHFTYVHSQNRHIIVDIQGVGDTYTDPQVHSTERQFGVGNLGQEGIDAFFESHQCNSICAGLGLGEAADDGPSAGPKGTVFVRN